MLAFVSLLFFIIPGYSTPKCMSSSDSSSHCVKVRGVKAGKCVVATSLNPAHAESCVQWLYPAADDLLGDMNYLDEDLYNSYIRKIESLMDQYPRLRKYKSQ